MASGLQFKEFWKAPWGYPQAVALNSGLVLVGWLIHVAQPITAPISLEYPWNVILLGVYVLAVTLLLVISRKTHFLLWLSGNSVAMTTVMFFAGLCFLSVLIPQNDSGDPIWLTHILGSFPFLLVTILLLTSLGLVTLRRAFFCERRSKTFILNHAGLWLTIVGMTFGAGDLTRLRVEVSKGSTSSNTMLPFQVTLKDFTIEEYQPRLVVIDGQNSETIEPVIGKSRKVLGHYLELIEFLPMAAPSGNGYIETAMPGAIAAARIRLDGKEAWISNGNATFDPKPLKLTEQSFVALTEASPKRYLSKVLIHQPGKADVPASIEVNRPLGVGGWKLYQASYNADQGRWSTVSIFEAVRDPWLPVVYSGLMLMLLGLIYFLWDGLAIHRRKAE